MSATARTMPATVYYSRRTAKLTVVPPVARRHRGGFTLACLTLCLAGVAALLLLNIAMAQGSFTLGDLRKTSGQLADTQADLTQRIAVVSAPQHLAELAVRMGMVPDTAPAFLRLSDGAVLGRSVPAPADPGYQVVTTVTAPAAPTSPGH